MKLEMVLPLSFLQLVNYWSNQSNSLKKVCILKLLSKVTERHVHNAWKELKKFLLKLPIKKLQRKENFSWSAPRHHYNLRSFPNIKSSSLKWLLMQYCIWMKICKRAILVSRKLPEVQYQIHSWSRVYASRKLSHTLVSNNNQNALKAQRLLFWILSSNWKQRRITLRLELIIQMISKRSLMLNGISFMRSLTRLLSLALKLSFQTCQLVI